MKLSDLETALLKLGPSFKKSATPATPIDSALRLEIDEVDFTVISDTANTDRVTVCCLFGQVPEAHTKDVLRRVVKLNVDLMEQHSTAGFGVAEGDLIYAFSTEVNPNPQFMQALGRVMRSAASNALSWQQSI